MRPTNFRAIPWISSMPRPVCSTSPLPAIHGQSPQLTFGGLFGAASTLPGSRSGGEEPGGQVLAVVGVLREGEAVDRAPTTRCGRVLSLCLSHEQHRAGITYIRMNPQVGCAREKTRTIDEQSTFVLPK